MSCLPSRLPPNEGPGNPSADGVLFSRPRARAGTEPNRPSGPGQQPIRSPGSRRCVRHCGAHRLLRNERNNHSPRPALSLFCGGENCFHIKGVLGGLSLAKSPHFEYLKAIASYAEPYRYLPASIYREEEADHAPENSRESLSMILRSPKPERHLAGRRAAQR